MQDDTTTESASISARTKGDQQLSEVLLNEVLPAGALPEAPTSTVEGQKALAEAFNGAVATKKKKEKSKETTVEEAEPKTAEEYETQYFLYQKNCVDLQTFSYLETSQTRVDNPFNVAFVWGTGGRYSI